jgi:glycosyltransferase involved in cell wall biosynthesis
VSSATVLIVEPHATGHRGVWLRWISEQLIKHEWRIVIATLVESLQQPAFAWLAQRSAAIEVVAVDQPGVYAPGGSLGALLAAELRCYRLLERLCVEACRSHFVDAVLLPYGDYGVHFTALLGSPFGALPWIPIVMRPTFHYRNMGVTAPQPALSALRGALFRSFVRTRSLATCLTIDQPLYEFMHADPEFAHKIGYLADPVDAIGSTGRNEARACVGIPADAVVVLVYGSLTSRKGMQYLLPAMCALRRTDLHVLCVGVPDAEFRTLLSGSDANTLMRAGRLHLIDRWADRATEAAAFAATDIVWLGYFGHWQSSGVLVQAGRAQLPSIACDAGLIGWTTARHQCGLVVPVRQRDAVVAALEALAASPELRANLGRNGIQAFAAHTADNAGAIISDALRDAVTRVPPKLRPASRSVDAMPTAEFPVRWNR